MDEKVKKNRGVKKEEKKKEEKDGNDRTGREWVKKAKKQREE